MRASRIALAAVALAPPLVWAAAHASSRAVRRWRPGAGARSSVAGLGVRRFGSGEPVVVLLSALASSERMWGAEFDVLGRHATVVAIDPIGFGGSMRSPLLEGPLDAAAHVDAVLAVLRVLGLDARPTVVVGHSMGASLALRVAARMPAARAVVAFDAPLFRTAAEADDRVRRMGWFEALLAQGPLAERVCRWMCRHRGLAEALTVAANPRLPVAVARDAMRHTWRGYLAGFDALVRDDGWRDALRALDERGVPVWLVDGVDDPVPVPGRPAELAAASTTVTAAQLPGGHQLPLGDPMGCASIVLGVLSVPGVLSGYSRAPDGYGKIPPGGIRS